MAATASPAPPITSYAELHDEMHSRHCRCGELKTPLNTFCWWCMKSLPMLHTIALYQPLGGAYVDARNEAAERLDELGRTPDSAVNVRPWRPQPVIAG